MPKTAVQVNSDAAMVPFTRRIAWGILVARLAYFDVLEVLRAKSINDYGSFHAAAMAVREGLDPYTPDGLQRAARLSGMPAVHPYFYPPLLAELLQPLTHLPLFKARLVWLAVSVGCFLGTIALLQRWLARRGDQATTALLVAVCALWPLRSTQMMAQVNALVLFLITLWWVRREKTPWAGIFLGLAAAIKMSPALLVLIPLTERRWREALIGAGSAGLLVLLSCAAIGTHGVHFAADVLLGFLPGQRYHGLRIPIDLLGNHSLGALAFWLFDRDTPHADPLRLSATAARFHMAAVLTLLFGFFVGVFRGAAKEGRAAALVVLMVLAPTFAFEHHLAFSVLPIAMIVSLVARGALTAAWTWALVPALALMTEHEASFLPPPDAALWHVAIGHMSKLIPLLVLYLAGLFAREAAASQR